MTADLTANDNVRRKMELKFDSILRLTEALAGGSRPLTPLASASIGA